MDVHEDSEMQAVQEDEGAREFCVYIQRGSCRELFNRIKGRWENLRIRWQNVMNWEVKIVKLKLSYTT